jgi:hypothetical protein
MTALRHAGLLLTLVVAASRVAAQGVDLRPVSDEAVRVFLDCDFCDSDYLRVETPWVAFVRDRAVADVHLLLTSQSTGGGGEQYTMLVLGQRAWAGRRDTVVFSTPPNTTDDAERAEITRNVQLALVPFAIRTSAGRGLRVAPPRRSGDDDDRPAGPDKWKAWVFEIGGDAELEKEERQSDVRFSGDFEAQRITAALKLGIEAGGEFQRSRFKLDEEDEEEGEPLTRTRERYSGGAVVVKSLGRKWGLGAELAVSSSTFENTELAARMAPAIEYTYWPYEESTRRQLTFQYSVGVSMFRYREETIFDRIRETRPTHAFVVGYDVQQPWGSADATLEAASYLDNRSQYRIVLDAEWSLRITSGLELEFGGSASRIRDQLSIPKRDATDDEILLELRALQTDYRYDARIGLSYTFGSIFNPVVNPRFGTGPGSILR